MSKFFGDEKCIHLNEIAKLLLETIYSVTNLLLVTSVVFLILAKPQ